VYTLIVTNTENNCTTPAEIEIFQDIEIPIADAGSDQTLNCNTTEITLDGSQSSSGQAFNYQWLNANDSLISTEISTPVSLPDTYIFIVTNVENNCSAEATVVVDQNLDTPTADAGTGGILTCDTDEILLDGSGSSGQNLSFVWYAEQLLLGVGVEIEVSQPGVYTLVVTNTLSGCADESTVEVVPDENLPTALASADGVLNCLISVVSLDGSASTSISGNIGFEWFDDENNIISDNENALATASGIFTLNVTDTDNGCSVSTTIQVQEDVQQPIAEAGENQTLNCGDTELNLDGSGSEGQNLTFEWRDEGGDVISNIATATAYSSGTFYLFVTNTQNGCVGLDSVEVIPDQNLPTADAGTAEPLTCAITEVTLDGSGSDTGQEFSYGWYNENDSLVGTDLQVP